MRPSRRGVLAASLLGVGVESAGRHAHADEAGPRLGSPSRFSFEALKDRARLLARTPYRPAPSPMADRLGALDFDAVGRIQYRPGAALWRDQPGVDAVEFFHLGKYAREPVTISVVEAGEAREVLYSPALFDIPAGDLASQLPANLGFAGFRVMNRDGHGDWIAYLGASYFRAATPFNQYGLSARGLAINTAGATPEEFPRFSAFWLSRDPAGRLVVCALLESASVAGAYRIVHHRDGGALTQEVEASLYFRKSVQTLGLAPLTSMFWYGPADRTKAADWRPQIHDSDGLSIWTGAGERIWRPLTDPDRVTTNVFVDANPKGFGLMQRDRAFEDYQDDGAFYDRRPSLWVEPVGDWGPGSVRLVEIPTAGETDDNIVAFWSPAAVKAADGLSFRYRLHWGDEEPQPLGVARTVATRQGVGGRPGVAAEAGGRKFVVDFAGGRLAGLTRQSGVTPVATAAGSPIAAAAYPVVGTDRWRLMFDIDPPHGNTVELRAFLRVGSEALTETWVFQSVG